MHYKDTLPFRNVYDATVKYSRVMAGIGASQLKRFDVVLVESSILRRKVSFRDESHASNDGSTKKLYGAAWDEVNWGVGFQIQDLSLIISAPDEFDDPDFPVPGAGVESHARKRDIEF